MGSRASDLWPVALIVSAALATVAVIATVAAAVKAYGVNQEEGTKRGAWASLVEFAKSAMSGAATMLL